MSVIRNALILSVFGGLLRAYGGNLHLAQYFVDQNPYSISVQDPLGSLNTIHGTLLDSGFELKQGVLGTSAVLTYEQPHDMQHGNGFASVAVIRVTGSSRISEISFVFASTQRGFSPQRMMWAESYARQYWKAQAKEVPKFKRIEGTIELTDKIKIPNSRMEADFDNEAIQGRWLYSEYHPQEVVTLSLQTSG